MNGNMMKVEIPNARLYVDDDCQQISMFDKGSNEACWDWITNWTMSR